MASNPREPQRCRYPRSAASQITLYLYLADDRTAGVGAARVRSSAAVVSAHRHAARVGTGIALLGTLHGAVPAMRPEVAARRAAAVKIVVVLGGEIAVLGELHLDDAVAAARTVVA